MRFIVIPWLVAWLLSAPVASAQEAAPVTTDFLTDGLITGLTLGTAVLSFLVSPFEVRREPARGGELLAFDEYVWDNFSSSAAKTADLTATLVALAPLTLELARPLDRRAADRAFIYSEALSVNLLLMQTVKLLVQRPRPYTHNANPAIQEYAAAEGDDAYLSFFSGHASTAFTAAVAGSFLFALSSTDLNSRAIVWGLELGLAAMTADLRVRAGKHYYTDVFVGALVGAAVGTLVPLLHQAEPGAYLPSTREWIGMASGLVLGILVGELLPLKDDVLLPLRESVTLDAVRVPSGQPPPVANPVRVFALTYGF